MIKGGHYTDVIEKNCKYDIGGVVYVCVDMFKQNGEFYYKLKGLLYDIETVLSDKALRVLYLDKQIRQLSRIWTMKPDGIKQMADKALKN